MTTARPQPIDRNPFDPRLSPSRLANLELCPCFDYQPYETADANEGTMLHKAYETGVTVGLDAEQIEAVTEVVQYTDALLAELTGKGQRVEDYKERGIKCPPMPGFGFADRVLISGVEGHILDAKFGRNGAPDAAVNLQGQCYVVGLALERPELKRITFHIMQPRCRPKNTWHTFELPGALTALRQRITAVIDKARYPFKVPVMQMDLCTKCRYIKECPAAAGALAPVGAGVAAPTVGVDVVRGLVNTPVGQMTPVQRGQTLALLELFEAAMKAKKQEVVGGVREGLPVEYYSLRKRKGNASICDPVAARALLQTLLDDDQILGAATLSVGKLVDAVADKLGVTKVEAEEQVRSALAPVMNSGAEISFLQRNRKISGLDVLMGRVPVSVDGDEESKQLKE